ncbi:hypothetical protein [Helicobacter pylori]|uniref:hypothetical protein n=1 Tax=Helicobacter pylori TaxID=210 RepID=UPI0015E75CFA|nr:hypothetical protein [Helicobacter pylori]
MARIELLPTQVDCIEKGLAILKKHGWVYYAMQERTGKTLTALFSAFQFKTTQAEIPNIFSVWDECFSSARNYIKTLSETNLDFLYTP